MYPAAAFIIYQNPNAPWKIPNNSGPKQQASFIGLNLPKPFYLDLIPIQIGTLGLPMEK